MLPITIALIVVQEMCARMGAVTGKGLSDLIREEFGLRMTFIVMLLLVIVNLATSWQSSPALRDPCQLFHVSKYIAVPVCAVLVWAMVVKGDYKSVEKIFLFVSVVYLAYIVAGVLGHPDWRLALRETVKLPPRKAWSDQNYLYMTVGVIGTTITPWMQFYLQSSIVEKGVTMRQYKASRLDVIVGSIFTGRRRVVHRCGVRGYAVCAWRRADQRAGRRRGGDAADRRRLRVSAVCRGPVQRVAVRRFHPAAFDGVHRMRGPWLWRAGWTARGSRRLSFIGCTRS